MIITPAAAVAGFRMCQTIGLVRGNTIRAGGLHDDVVARIKNMIGGEVEEYTRLIAAAREQAIDRMVQQARELGANAVTDVRFASIELMEGAAEILVYGNACVIEPSDSG